MQGGTPVKAVPPAGLRPGGEYSPEEGEPDDPVGVAPWPGYAPRMWSAPSELRSRPVGDRVFVGAVVELHAAGLSRARIAVALGVGEARVRRALHRAGTA